MLERPVELVGPEGRHHPQPVLGLGGMGQQVGEVIPPSGVGHEGPQLFELVHHQEQLLAGCHQPPRHLHEAARCPQAGSDRGLGLGRGDPT